MSLTNSTITYGKDTITFHVLYVSRRTLEIAVHPDSDVVVKAPVGTEFSEVKKIVTKRARWIIRQLNYFRQFNPRTPRRLYIGGETHLYLGRQYRLKISKGSTSSIRLTRGYFQVTITEEESMCKVKNLLDGWYRQKATEKFSERLEHCWPLLKKLSLPRPGIQVRRLKKRWGSLSKNGTLTLNVDLIRAPKECIDYVITHELCHLKQHDHSPRFYSLLETIMPDWEKRKHKLELTLA